MSRPKQLSIILVSLLGIAACAGTLDSEQPAERTYWLTPLIAQGADSASDSLPSLVVTVGAAPGLDTDRMLILQTGARLNHYQAARWPDNVPEVLESLLRRTLESTGEYARVSGGKDTRSADSQLELEVREFYTVAGSSAGARKVRVALSGYVNCHDADHALSLLAEVDLGDERLSLIVAAHERALHEVSMSLVSQLSQACGSKE
jgi:ABC-type uncharacterized transport system auxiliary subunit